MPNKSQQFKTKSISVVCFLKGLRGNLLCRGENEKQNVKPRNPVCIIMGDPYKGLQSLPLLTNITLGTALINII